VLRDSIHQQATASSTAMTNPMGIFATAPTCADLGDQLGLRDAAGLGGLGLERAGDQPPRDAGGDVVEHDRGDDLVHPATRLEDTGDPPDEGTGHDARAHAEHGPEEAVATGRVGDPGAEHGAEDQLALATDVEQAHAQWQHDGQAGEHQRGRLLQGAGQPAGHEQACLISVSYA
jgi:hypothetical protein